MTPAFADMGAGARHEWASHIVENIMAVDPQWESQAAYLKKYIAWIRGEEKQGDLFENA